MSDIDWHDLSDFVGGWFVGNFSPSIYPTEDFEVCVKRYGAGDVEVEHHQLVATEITVIVSGRCRLAGRLLQPNQIAVIPPGVPAAFEAIEDTVLVAVKFPSIPSDKVVDAP